MSEPERILSAGAQFALDLMTAATHAKGHGLPDTRAAEIANDFAQDMRDLACTVAASTTRTYEDGLREAANKVRSRCPVWPPDGPPNTEAQIINDTLCDAYYAIEEILALLPTDEPSDLEQRADIEAETARMGVLDAAPAHTGVKALAWEYHQTTYTHRDIEARTSEERPAAEFWEANPPHLAIRYSIMRLVYGGMKGPQKYRLEIGGKEHQFDTLEAAKAAAQSDYEARILSALEPGTVAQAARVLLDNMDIVERVTGGIFAVQMQAALRALSGDDQ